MIDGDTIDVLHEGRAQRVRLHGIDAPERGQDFGRKAKDFVLKSAAGKEVSVRITDRDKYGRWVGEVYLPDGRSLNEEIVQNGYAWWYRKYSDDPVLARLEEEAREAGRGLWSHPNPVPPWKWRHGAKKPKKAAQPSEPRFKCGAKGYCGEMASCEEAMFYLRECGLTRLDGDNDGIPCEALCQ